MILTHPASGSAAPLQAPLYGVCPVKFMAWRSMAGSQEENDGRKMLSCTCPNPFADSPYQVTHSISMVKSRPRSQKCLGKVPSSEQKRSGKDVFLPLNKFF